MTATFVNPILIALATAIENDGPLGGLLAGDKIYSGLAPMGAAYPHVAIPNATDTPMTLFGLGSSQVVVNLDIWTQGPGIMGVTGIYEALVNLLHNKRLTLSNGSWMSGRMRLVLSNLGDTTDPTIVRGVSEYTVRACG